MRGKNYMVFFSSYVQVESFVKYFTLFRSYISPPYNAQYFKLNLSPFN